MSDDAVDPAAVERQALAFLRRALPETWIVEEMPGDPYLGALVELTAADQPTGRRFAVLARSLNAPHRRQGVITLPGMRLEVLEHVAAYPDPVLLLLYDASRDAGYWLWLKSWIEGARSPRWETIRSTAVSIPESNALDADAVRRIAADLGAPESVPADWTMSQKDLFSAAPAWLREPLSTGDVEERTEDEDRAVLKTAELEMEQFMAGRWANPPGEEVRVEDATPPEPAAEVATLPEAEVSAPEAPISSARPVVMALRFRAVLRTVAARNYLSYGTAGGRRYGPHAVEAPEPETSLLGVALDWLHGEDVILSVSDVTLRQDVMDEDHVVWVGRSPAYGLQVVWAWDFFRLLSHLYLDIRLPARLTPTQQVLLNALASLVEGDVLRVRATGLDQRHSVTAEVLAARDSGL